MVFVLFVLKLKLNFKTFWYGSLGTLDKNNLILLQSRKILLLLASYLKFDLVHIMNWLQNNKKHKIILMSFEFFWNYDPN